MNPILLFMLIMVIISTLFLFCRYDHVVERFVEPKKIKFCAPHLSGKQDKKTIRKLNALGSQSTANAEYDDEIDDQILNSSEYS